MRSCREGSCSDGDRCCCCCCCCDCGGSTFAEPGRDDLEPSPASLAKVIDVRREALSARSLGGAVDGVVRGRAGDSAVASCAGAAEAGSSAGGLGTCTDCLVSPLAPAAVADDLLLRAPAAEAVMSVLARTRLPLRPTPSADASVEAASSLSAARGEATPRAWTTGPRVAVTEGKAAAAACLPRKDCISASSCDGSTSENTSVPPAAGSSSYSSSPSVHFGDGPIAEASAKSTAPAKSTVRALPRADNDNARVPEGRGVGVLRSAMVRALCVARAEC